MENKRKTQRALVSLKAIAIYEKNPNVFLLKNISKSGAFIETLSPFEIGSGFRLLFALNDPEQVVNIECHVVRNVKSESKAQDYVVSGMGLEFVNISFENESMIDDYISYITPLYDEINILLSDPRKNIDRLEYLLSKIGEEKYSDLFELKEKIKYVCLSLGLINN